MLLSPQIAHPVPILSTLAALGEDGEAEEDVDRTIGQRWEYFERSAGVGRLSAVCSLSETLLAGLSILADAPGATHGCLSFFVFCNRLPCPESTNEASAQHDYIAVCHLNVEFISY